MRERDELPQTLWNARLPNLRAIDQFLNPAMQIGHRTFLDGIGSAVGKGARLEAPLHLRHIAEILSEYFSPERHIREIVRPFELGARLLARRVAA